MKVTHWSDEQDGERKQVVDPTSLIRDQVIMIVSEARHIVGLEPTLLGVTPGR